MAVDSGGVWNSGSGSAATGVIIRSVVVDMVDGLIEGREGRRRRRRKLGLKGT